VGVYSASVWGAIILGVSVGRGRID